MSNKYETKVIDHLGLVAGMYNEMEIGEIIDKSINQDFENRKVSIGQAVKSMVLNGLGFVNKQLYLIPSFFKNKPVERLIGKNVEYQHLNDDTLGRALDAIYDYNVTELFSKIASNSAKKLGLEVKFAHVDSTSLHVDGKYNSEDEAEEGVIHITKGYSRDHRPELNQVVLDMIVENRARIPILMKPLNGNSSDKNDFRQLIKENIEQLKNNYDVQYIVADSAMYTEENLNSMNDIKWISIVPEMIKESKKLIEDNDIESMISIDEYYKYRSVKSNYGGITQRWLLIHSEQAKQRGKKSMNKKFLKEGEKEAKAFKKLCTKKFACEADALKIWEEFQERLKFTTVQQMSIIETKHYGKRGKPKKDTVANKITYNIEEAIVSSLSIYQYKIQQKGYFILASNELDEKKLSDLELFKEYKNQNCIESGFRFLKSPDFLASSLYLKSPKRITALLMIMTICLLVYAALEYKIRQELKKRKATFPNQKGKSIDNPTARWIFHSFFGIHLLIVRGVGTRH